MTKYLVRLETDVIRWFKIKKAHRELITLHGRLYRNDDCLYVKDKHSSDAIRLTPIDSNQVGKPRPIYIDPNDTRAIIMSKEISGQKTKAWFNMDASKLWMYLLGFIIGGVVLYTALTGGLKI